MEVPFCSVKRRVLSMAFSVLLLMPVAVFALGDMQLDIQRSDTARAIANVTVEISLKDQPVARKQTDANGVVRFTALNDGVYTAHISRSGFYTKRVTDIRIIDGRVTVQAIELTEATGKVEELVVVARAKEVNDTGSVGASYLSREGLRSAAGSGSDVLRALDGMPGLFSDGEFASFTVRGRGPRDNLILVDGVPFANVVHFSESFGEQEELEGGGRYSVFAPNLIEGARFEPGGWGAAQGGPAGALLELDVAAGSLEAATYTARIDLGGIEVGYEGPSQVFDNTSLLFSARQLDFGRVFETVGAEEFGSPTLTDVILKTHTEISDQDTLNTLLIYAPEAYERTIDNVLASDEDNIGDFEGVELADNEAKNQLFSVHWQRLLGEAGEWNNRLYYRYFDEQSRSGEVFPDQVPLGTPKANIPQDPDILRSSRDETAYGLRSHFANDNNWGRYQLGVDLEQVESQANLSLTTDWQRFVYDQDDFRPSPQQRFITLTPAVFDSRYDDSGLFSAVFAEQSLDIASGRLRLGLRAERDDFSGQTALLPRIGFNWQFDSRNRATITAGRYQQAPDLTIRARDTENRQLENEVVDQVSAGFETLLSDNYELFAEAYYQRHDQLIVEADQVNQVAANSGSGRAYGVDVALTRRFAEGWSGNINYSYNQSEERECDSCPYYDADFQRTHSFNVGGIWQINQRWKISSRWKWASGLPRDSFITHANVLGDGQPLRFSKEIVGTNDLRYGAFHSLNFRLDYQRSFGATEMIAFFDVINAYGAENPNNAEFNAISGQEEASDGQILPIFGIRFTW